MNHTANQKSDREKECTSECLTVMVGKVAHGEPATLKMTDVWTELCTITGYKVYQPWTRLEMLS